MPVWAWALTVIAAGWVVFVVVFAPFKHGDHEAPRGLTPDVHDQIVQIAAVKGRPPWMEGLPDWAAPEAPRRASYGWISGAGGSDYDLMRAAIRAESSGPFDQRAPDGIPGSADVPRNLDAEGTGRPRPVPGAGDESEASGLPAPPVPPDPRHLADTWLDAQLADLFAWVRDVHTLLAAS